MVMVSLDDYQSDLDEQNKDWGCRAKAVFNEMEQVSIGDSLLSDSKIQDWEQRIEAIYDEIMAENIATTHALRDAFTIYLRRIKEVHDLSNNSLLDKNLPNNSKICAYKGYKLSSIIPDIACSDNVVQINIGCDDDDTFYSDSDKEGRVQIIVETEESMIYIDLEHVLEFAKQFCTGIFWKVANVDALHFPGEGYDV